jgi:hypothetical protein
MRNLAALLTLAAFLGLVGLANAAQPKDDPQSLIPSGSGSTPIYRHSEGKATTSMFGITAEGYKFVYVMDRSGSMGGSAQVALKAVKSELARSLEGLDAIHQFQIIFYNEKPVVFNPTGVSGKLAFANEDNKARAVRFINSITPDGGTKHEEAIKTAIRLHPDAIFFLTDGDEPGLSAEQIDAISGRASGIAIHTIEFGIGPAPKESFMAKLAKANRGEYSYVDLTERIQKQIEERKAKGAKK